MTDSISHSYRSVKRWIGFTDGALHLGRVANSLADSKITELARLTVKEAGKKIGALHLSVEALEDTYLRILIQQGKMSAEKATNLWKKLHNTDGFVTTLRKVSSMNTAQVSGHLFELNLAQEAAKNGFEVLGIGKKFRDPAKKALTDLDVLIRKGGKNYLIEAKSYTDTKLSSLPHFRADMDSLGAFGEGVKVFVIKERLSD